MHTKPIKIAFVGTCCSGKTTLFEYLQKIHKGNKEITFVTEAAREVLARSPQFHKDRLSIDAQRAIQRQVMENERTAFLKSSGLIICDRCIIDPLVYLHSTGRKNEVDVLFQEVCHWVPTYGKIILFNPHDIPYVQDNVRTESPKKRIELHNAYLKFFQEKRITFDLLSGTLKKRVLEISRIINGKLPD